MNIENGYEGLLDYHAFQIIMHQYLKKLLHDEDELVSLDH